MERNQNELFLLRCFRDNLHRNFSNEFSTNRSAMKRYRSTCDVDHREEEFDKVYSKIESKLNFLVKTELTNKLRR